MKTLAERIDRIACAALRRELQLECKPGLVTPSARGSHADMDFHSFEASIAALQGYFADCVLLAGRGCGLAALQQRGQRAEQAMLAATGGVNTHKGAVFTLGLLAAAAGVQLARGESLAPAVLGDLVAQRWGDEILRGASQAPTGLGAPTHGARLRRELGLPGAREHAGAGFPVLFETTLPQLGMAYAAGLADQEAGLHALLATIAVLPDTNLAHRGGLTGLDWARGRAARLMAAGGAFANDWRAAVDGLCADFVLRWLSPGGSADLLAAAWMLHALRDLRHGAQRAAVVPA